MAADKRCGTARCETIGRVFGTIDHVGIAVKDLASGLRFYCDFLGMHLKSTESVLAEGVTVALLQPPSVESPQIELLEGSSPDSPISNFLEKRGPGLHHIALRVENLSRACRAFEQRGAQLLNEPKIGAGGHRYVFVHPRATGGVLLELVEKEIG